MISDHLFLLFSSEGDSELFSQVGSLWRTGMCQTPSSRRSDFTALSKPDGGVRGIVVGDIVRRFVARTIDKQARQLGCVFQDMEPFDFEEKLKHTETNPMCSIHKSRRTSR